MSNSQITDLFSLELVYLSMFSLMKLNLKSDLKFHRFAIYFFLQIETLTCTTRYYKSRSYFQIKFRFKRVFCKLFLSNKFPGQIRNYFFQLSSQVKFANYGFI